MAYESAGEAWQDLLLIMSGEEGVTSTESELLVHGTVFAFREGDDIVVEVPAARASDLKARGVASKFSVDGHTSRDWVRVSDLQLWPELAREAHEFVGEPAVGGES
ncbi:hypothetical protein [Subtercola lobariae]|uniref:TfoX N-terminal domain-containing protein n=1 Tax=Subtercola lobariae TaxID=1588641 RepID=A0A917EVN2_9MICO|nr:hypothetical protein [Subtercola lobariae]GGF21199.1 hypothetical protein GCM10011399_13580 [Subtercola lobariae]